MPEYSREPDNVLDLDAGPSSAELQDQVQRAQAELSDLKRRAEQIERDKTRLEELGRKQDELEQGRVEMIDRLTRSMVVLQRESEEAQRRLDNLSDTQNSFLRHLRTLESINPKQWVGADLAKELSKALSAVDDARAEFTKAKPRLASESHDEPSAPAGGDYEEYYAAGGEKGFLYWLTTGFAFTLPLIVTLITVALLIWLSVQSAPH